MCDETASHSVSSRQDLLMTSLTEFFKNKNHLNQMLPILNQTAHISLRILDWFVTNYAKKKKIVYSTNGQMFNVYLNYKSQLKAYSKKQFDPFCRKIRKVNGKQIYEGIKFYYDDNKYIETTVGQLNFFRWAISNGVLSYIIDHLTDIVDDMILSTKKKKESAKKTKATKSPSTSKALNITSEPKKEMAISATKTVTTQHIKVVVSFS